MGRVTRISISVLQAAPHKTEWKPILLTEKKIINDVLVYDLAAQINSSDIPTFTNHRGWILTVHWSALPHQTLMIIRPRPIPSSFCTLPNISARPYTFLLTMADPRWRPNIYSRRTLEVLVFWRRRGAPKVQTMVWVERENYITLGIESNASLFKRDASSEDLQNNISRSIASGEQWGHISVGR